MENWLTRLELSFEDPAFERRWREDNYSRSLIQVRLATAIAVLIYGAYGFVDPIILPPEVADLYAHMCPAAVYEEVDGELRVNAPNCVDCKATDVLGPRWTPREGGSGPVYKQM